jgi:hypothetical protein
MADACRDRRGDIAALALGRLTPPERVAIGAHIDGCPACRGAYAELSATVRALPAADLAHVDTEPAPSVDLSERITREVLRARHRDRRRRRSRALAVMAAAAAALVLVLGAIALVRDDNPSMQAFADQAPGVDGTFAVRSNEQGAAVRLAYRGLDHDDVYWLWLTDASGRRVSAGTFRGADGDSVVVLQSALPADVAVRIWVTDAEDTVLLDAPIAH